ncbi:YfmQ family protein [Bacillus sp. 31A1R]|uniref:YfmQ family protein n=1 Tax=Robertmurraya mangrovi TaxID=3098077 RepID=A0ABU5J1F8_9BACI|nr:YfmQ family protein [Bacillus sp. 31A1R]MDZ5473253.1 YfmQ family protein [Bacillus sp. 31A1R]
MTWVAVISIIVASLLKILLTCLPTGTVNWLLGKFEVHSKLNEKDIRITVSERVLVGEEKTNMVRIFNEAIFMKRNYIYPGNEKNFLYPVESGVPIVIESLDINNNMRIFIYSYSDRIDVVKQFKGKVISYSLFCDSFQNCSISFQGSLEY